MVDTAEKEKKESTTDKVAGSAKKEDAAAPSLKGVVKKETKDKNRKPLHRRRRIVRREERARSEFDQKIISIRRVVRVMAGGRRFSFSVAIVIGDKKGSVGIGTGKASDTAFAIEKAARNAKKNIVKLSLDKAHRILHEVEAKYCASRVWLSPAPGKGLVAGSSVRVVLELGGVKDVTAKIRSRSKNKLNNANATMCALAKLR